MNMNEVIEGERKEKGRECMKSRKPSEKVLLSCRILIYNIHKIYKSH